MSKLTCILLDDYQGAAKATDSWRRLAGSMDVAFMKGGGVAGGHSERGDGRGTMPFAQVT